MEKRVLAIALVLGFVGWLGLLVIEWQFGLGRFAESPQEILLTPGRRSIVGGGRAVLGLVERRGKSVTVEVSCAGEKRRLELDERVSSGEICGVSLSWSDAAAVAGSPFGSVTFEVSWTEEAGR